MPVIFAVCRLGFSTFLSGFGVFLCIYFNPLRVLASLWLYVINLLAHSNIGVFLCLVPRSRGPYENNQRKIDLKARMGGAFF